MANNPDPRAAARRPLAERRCAQAPPPAGRRRRARALLAAAALLAVLAGALASAPAAAQEPDGEVRIVARKHTDGRIEFALQQRQTDDTWGDRQLPRSRFFPTTAATGRWLASTPLAVGAPGASADGYTAISAGGDITCAIRTNGTIACWGRDGVGQARAPDGQFSAITTSAKRPVAYDSVASWAVPSHSCGLRTDGTIACWGGNDSGQSDAPDGQYTAIAAGPSHTCAIRADGTIACWGDDDYHKVSAPGGTCAIRASETIACTGGNGDGPNGAPDVQHATTATGGNPWFADDYDCAIRADSTIACTGSRGGGPEGQFIAVAGGDYHVCALATDGTITCWGRSDDHLDIRVDHGNLDVPEGRFIAVSAGSFTSCGMRADGSIECWGRDALYLPAR